jgi:hypothetical protein
MAAAGIVDCSPYGMACTECNELVIAPEWSEYVGKHEVRHFWSCENCGHVRTSGESPDSAQAGRGPQWPYSAEPRQERSL